MGDRSSDASALLGVEGFVVFSQSEEDGEVWVLVETTATVAGGPSCGVKATGHGRSVVQVRDLASRRPGRCAWCGAAAGGCAPTPAVTPRASRSRRRPSKRPSPAGRPKRSAAASADGYAVAQVARDFGVGWARVPWPASAATASRSWTTPAASG